MANYFLFLDELKPNNIYKHFCLGGIFVEEEYYRKEMCEIGRASCRERV